MSNSSLLLRQIEPRFANGSGSPVWRPALSLVLTMLTQFELDMLLPVYLWISKRTTPASPIHLFAARSARRFNT
jgi:hypothetical protein